MCNGHTINPESRTGSHRGSVGKTCVRLSNGPVTRSSLELAFPFVDLSVTKSGVFLRHKSTTVKKKSKKYRSPVAGNENRPIVKETHPISFTIKADMDVAPSVFLSLYHQRAMPVRPQSGDFVLKKLKLRLSRPFCLLDVYALNELSWSEFSWSCHSFRF